MYTLVGKIFPTGMLISFVSFSMRLDYNSSTTIAAFKVRFVPLFHKNCKNQKKKLAH